MTPTMRGRWFTRLFLTGVIGVPVTLFYMLMFGAFSADGAGVAKMPLLVVWMTVLGLALDPAYYALQTLRWDRDWPMAFHIAAGLLEGILTFTLFALGALPGADCVEGDGGRFIVHYGSMFLLMVAMLWGPMRVLFPKWRFRGGVP